ncbi:MAG: LysM peptidoglycan-binding domain-containing protein [Chloroflexota bacterium]|nr:LysM peptidoglycan-binding domain-containing protein [Chloroflexota bacterium]
MKQMKKARLSLPLSMVVLLIVSSLIAGCYREAAPDVEETPASGAQADQPEGTPDIMATAQANATLSAQGGEATPVAGETPTVEAPTALPTSAATTVSTTPAPTHTSIPSTPAPTPTPLPTGQVMHTVQPGENLFRIALRYNTTVEAISAANGIANPAMIHVGQVLTISSSGVQPPTAGETTYAVQPGDNLFRIALRYNMSYVSLAQYNNIANPSTIYVGQVIRIP